MRVRLIRGLVREDEEVPSDYNVCRMRGPLDRVLMRITYVSGHLQSQYFYIIFGSLYRYRQHSIHFPHLLLRIYIVVYIRRCSSLEA